MVIVYIFSQMINGTFCSELCKVGIRSGIIVIGLCSTGKVQHIKSVKPALIRIDPKVFADFLLHKNIVTDIQIEYGMDMKIFFNLILFHLGLFLNFFDDRKLYTK